MAVQSGTSNAQVRRTLIGACNLCEAICGLRIDLEGDRVTAIRGDPDDPLSRGHLCPKAVALRDVHEDPDRLRHPMRRTGNGWERMGWDDALDLVASRLAGIRRDHGADAVGVYLGNPVIHSLGAMTHGLPFVRMLGTRNRYSPTSVDSLPHQLVAMLMYGNQWLLPVPDIDRTRYLLLLGTNPMASNGSVMTVPDFPRRLRDLRRRGGHAVVFDPRRTETAKAVDEHHFVRPGTDAALLFAMVRVVLEEGLDRARGYVDGLDDVRRAVDPFTPERAAEVTGVPSQTIRRIARDFATADSAACHARTGLSTQRFGALCQWGVQLLNVVTGNLDREGGTLFTAPAIDAIRSGMLPDGHYDTWRSRVRGLPEFDDELPLATLADEIATPGEGQVRALLTIAGNPVLSAPGGDRLARALSGLEFMVAVDFYINETTRHADVILPTTDVFERDQYAMVFHTMAVRNTARYVPPVLPRPEGSLHDWEIFRELGRRYRRRIRGAGSLLDRTMLRISPARLVDLGLRAGPARLSLRELRRHPSGVDLGPLRPSLPGRLRTPDRRVHGAPELLLADVERAVRELLDQDRPAGSGTSSPTIEGLRLIGRRHLRTNNSWMHNSPRLVKGRPLHRLLMNPADLAARGLTDGALVRVASATGEVEVEVEASDDMMPGVVSLPHGYGHALPGVRLSIAGTLPGASANDVTDPQHLDDLGATAALNGVPVTVTAVAD